MAWGTGVGPQKRLVPGATPSGSTGTTQTLTDVVAPANRKLEIDATATYNVVRSQNTYSGNLDQTFYLKIVARNTVPSEDWHSPNFCWGANAGLTTGPKIVFSPTYFHFQLPGGEEFEAALNPAPGTLEKFRVTQVGSLFTFYRNDVQVVQFTDATIATSGYIGFTMLEGICEIDNLSGTFTETFESVTPGVYGDAVPIGTSLVKVQGFDITVVQEGDAEPYDGPVIAYYGDSTVEGMNGGAGDDFVAVPAPERVAVNTGWIVYNEGVSSTNSIQLLNGTDGVHPAWDTELANSNAMYIIINHGINDWEQNETQYKATFNALIDTILARGRIPILETPNPTYQLLSGSDEFADQSVGDRAQWMRDVATARSVFLIDQFQMITDYFVSSGTTAAQFTPDGLHPTQAGYTLKGDYATTRLQTLIGVESDPERIADLSKALGNVTLSATASVVINAAASVALGNATLSSAGSVPTSATLSKALGNVTLASTASVSAVASLNKSLGNVTASSDADPSHVITVAGTLGNVTSSSSVGSSVAASLSKQLGDVTLSATVQNGVTANHNSKLGNVTLSSSASASVTASADNALGNVSLVSAAQVTATAGLSKALDNVTLESNANAEDGTANCNLNVALGDITVSSTASSSVTATLDKMLDAIVAAADADAAAGAIVAGILGNVTSDSNAGTSVSANLSVALGSVTLTAVAVAIGADQVAKPSPDRTLQIAAVSRTISIEAQARTIAVPAASRNISLEADSRLLTITRN